MENDLAGTLRVPSAADCHGTRSAPIPLKWDAVVIGGGVSGAITARQLAQSGLTVLLVDKARFPRRKVCGGCLNAAALTLLEQIGLGALPWQLGARAIRQICLATSGRSVQLPLARGAAISREALDAALIDEAVAAGACFRSGVTARIGRYAGAVREVELTGADGKCTVAAQAIVVASGLHGEKLADDELLRPVPTAGSRIGAGVILECAPAEFEPGTIRMAVGPGGYVGSVLVERNRLCISAALDRRSLHFAGGLSAAAAAIVAGADLPWPSQAAALQWMAVPPLTRRPRRVCGRRLFLVGDAAGYVEPFTGEGMAWAIQSACAVAPVVCRVASNQLDPESGEWSRLHQRLLGRQMTVCGIVSHLLRQPRLVRAAIVGLSWFPSLARRFTQPRTDRLRDLSARAAQDVA